MLLGRTAFIKGVALSLFFSARFALADHAGELSPLDLGVVRIRDLPSNSRPESLTREIPVGPDDKGSRYSAIRETPIVTYEDGDKYKVIPPPHPLKECSIIMYHQNGKNSSWTDDTGMYYNYTYAVDSVKEAIDKEEEEKSQAAVTNFQNALSLMIKNEFGQRKASEFNQEMGKALWKKVSRRLEASSDYTRKLLKEKKEPEGEKLRMKLLNVQSSLLKAVKILMTDYSEGMKEKRLKSLVKTVGNQKELVDAIKECDKNASYLSLKTHGSEHGNGAIHLNKKEYISAGDTKTINELGKAIAARKFKKVHLASCLVGKSASGARPFEQRVLDNFGNKLAQAIFDNRDPSQPIPKREDRTVVSAYNQIVYFSPKYGSMARELTNRIDFIGDTPEELWAAKHREFERMISDRQSKSLPAFELPNLEQPHPVEPFTFNERSPAKIKVQDWLR